MKRDAKKHAAPREPLRTHRVWRLVEGLAVVFKPKGHTEPEHCHPYPMRLRVLRGCLEIRLQSSTRKLRSPGRPLVLAAGVPHATRAIEDTWVWVEVASEPRLHKIPASAATQGPGEGKARRS